MFSGTRLHSELILNFICPQRDGRDKYKPLIVADVMVSSMLARVTLTLWVKGKDLSRLTSDVLKLE